MGGRVSGKSVLSGWLDDDDLIENDFSKKEKKNWTCHNTLRRTDLKNDVKIMDDPNVKPK